jgi:hypothetical protein
VSAAPDYITPFTGWRGWRIVDHGTSVRLLSVVQETVWNPGQALEAECASGHQPPNSACSCGVYAARSLEHLRAINYHGHGCLGEVHLWGQVVEATLGFRAAKAYPKRLYIPYESWTFAKPLRATYQVPVRLFNPYEGRL